MDACVDTRPRSSRPPVPGCRGACARAGALARAGAAQLSTRSSVQRSAMPRSVVTVTPRMITHYALLDTTLPQRQLSKRSSNSASLSLLG